jgi:hypothetical protein
MCAGCDEQKLVHARASFCSANCRNRVWRQRHGAGNRRREFCAWCNSPLLYMPQDRLPAVRRYCDDTCARHAWLVARARQRMTAIKPLDVAVHRLRKSLMPTVLAAAFTLVELRRELADCQQADSAARVAAFLSKLPPAA